MTYEINPTQIIYDQVGSIQVSCKYCRLKTLSNQSIRILDLVKTILNLWIGGLCRHGPC